MFLRKQIHEQIQTAGVRLGDSCSIFPSHGRKKAFTLNRHCIDLISSRYRPQGLSMSYIELPHFEANHFHYRLELDETTPQVGRFVLKTIKGNAFWINGLAAKEAYVERAIAYISKIINSILIHVTWESYLAIISSILFLR